MIADDAKIAVAICVGPLGNVEWQLDINDLDAYKVVD